jgi:integrase
MGASVEEVKKRYRKTFMFEGRRVWVDGETEREAIEKRALRRHELEEGRRRIDRNMCVRDWVVIYMETYKRPTLAAESYKALLSIQRKWIDSAIGGIALKSVRSIQCQTILNAMAAKGLSGKHIKRAKHHLSAMFEKAIANGLLIENPMTTVETPKAKDGQRRAATLYERTLLLEVCSWHKYGLWPLFMLYTGAGPEESARMIGKFLDFENNRIWIDGVKNEARPRWVPMPAVLRDLLEKEKTAPFEHLFKNSHGHRLTKSNMRDRWAVIVKEMNIAAGCKTDYGSLKRVLPPVAIPKDLTPYCMRHTYCTDLQDVGVPINVAKDLMGHTSIETTARIYTELTKTSFDRARELIDESQDRLRIGKKADGMRRKP